MTNVAVIDIGKTNAKVALVDLDTLSEIAVLRVANTVVTAGIYPHHDVGRLWKFILDSLGTMHRDHGVDAISITTHGATAAVIDKNGELVLPVLDYEYNGPDEVRAEYEKLCPSFEETGSPQLPLGLNLGAQLYWQSRMFPDAFADIQAILTYPQYWAWRLTGIKASELTSLGCHTDLWAPYKQDFSSLVDTLGWRTLFPPVHAAAAILGPIRPGIAHETGLPQTTPVACGIHDSNASLLPHLISRTSPFSVVSTGTWVVAMAIGARTAVLDATRDTLINVNAFGDPVPSARFMGGREFDMLMSGRSTNWNDADITAVLDEQIMLLPSVVEGSGPFPSARSHWTGAEPSGGARFVAISFYLALMTATCLDLIGADGPIIVEGPFASNDAFRTMLAAATQRVVTTNPGGSTGTSVGAAMLCDIGSFKSHSEVSTAAFNSYQRQVGYASVWRRLISHS